MKVEEFLVKFPNNKYRYLSGVCFLKLKLKHLD